MESLTADAPDFRLDDASLSFGHNQGTEKPSFLEVFEAEESSLLRYAHGLVGQRETAEDLVQETFCKAHTHWDQIGHPRAWLFRALRNLALNHLRDHRRETHLDPDRDWPDHHANPSRAMDRREAIGTLQLLVEELAPADRALIALKYRENLRYEQISERSGLSVGNVGYKLHHALKHLADSMRRLGIESFDA